MPKGKEGSIDAYLDDAIACKKLPRYKVKDKATFDLQHFGFEILENMFKPNTTLTVGMFNVLVETVAADLVSCCRSVRIDNEHSRYPFLYVLLKALLRFSDEKNFRISTIAKTLEVDVLKKEQLADEFAAEEGNRASLENEIEDEDQPMEALREVILRWERYFSASGSSGGGGCGYVEIAIKSALRTMLLVECKECVEPGNTSVSESNGFWQTASEVVAARDNNIAAAEEEAAKVQIALWDVNSVNAARGTVLKRKLSKAARKEAENQAQARAMEHAAQRAAAVEAANSLVEVERNRPVFGVLTDFNHDWIFVRLDKQQIRVSPAIRMFRFKGNQLESDGDVYEGLRYLCEAVGISGGEAGMRAKLDLIRTADQLLANSFIDSVRKKDISGNARANFRQGLMAGGMTDPVAIEQLVMNKFPEK